jgi:hypothetical protein
MSFESAILVVWGVIVTIAIRHLLVRYEKLSREVRELRKGELVVKSEIEVIDLIPEIQDEVEKALKAAAREEPRATAYRGMGYPRLDRYDAMIGMIQRKVRMSVDRDASALMEKRIRELTEPESFIDGIVERLKRKQLNG